MLSRNSRGFLADIQALRQRVRRELDQREARTIAIVGLWPSSGTTTLSVLLGRSLADEGRETLLVDANSARATLHKPWRLSPAPGVSDVLAHTDKISEAVRETDVPNLKVLPIGASTSSTKSLSTSASWRKSLEALASEHGIVLVDAGSADSPSSFEVAAACDLTITVANAGTVRREAIRGRVAKLRDHGANVLGLILNKRHYSIPDFVYRRL